MLAYYADVKAVGLAAAAAAAPVVGACRRPRSKSPTKKETESSKREERARKFETLRNNRDLRTTNKPVGRAIVKSRFKAPEPIGD